MVSGILNDGATELVEFLRFSRGAGAGRADRADIGLR